MRDFESEVYNALGIGSNNAKSRKQLCAELKCSDRILRETIERLRNDYPIITDDNGKGYYLPSQNAQGRRDTIRWLGRQDKRIQSIKAAQKGARDFIEPCKTNQISGQINMFTAAESSL